ncbi:hypothetical protein [Skermania sp. ID1734]|uniref:hypothetical protein n=1 Tax=Skermania sp. ID1734 TaxID=2597516 RepID=UPI00163DA651|nr:hypothetical protein [Skermania sp. ID1734]
MVQHDKDASPQPSARRHGAVIWPEPSPLASWWQRIMKGHDVSEPGTDKAGG